MESRSLQRPLSGTYWYWPIVLARTPCTLVHRLCNNHQGDPRHNIIMSLTLQMESEFSVSRFMTSHSPIHFNKAAIIFSPLTSNLYFSVIQNRRGTLTSRQGFHPYQVLNPRWIPRKSLVWKRLFRRSFHLWIISQRDSLWFKFPADRGKWMWFRLYSPSRGRRNTTL